MAVAARKQLRDPLLYALLIHIDDAGGRVFDYRDLGFDLREAYPHLCGERRAFARAHLFEVIQGFADRPRDSIRDRFIDTAARRAQSARQTCERIDVHIAQQIEFFLNVAQRADITADQLAIDFVSCFARALQIDD